MDEANVQLDGAPFQRAMQPILESLRDFRAAVVALDSSPTGKLSAEMQALKTSAVGMVSEMERAARKMPEILEKEINKAGITAKAASKKAGAAAGAELMEEAARTVRANARKLQAEYENAVSKGWKFKAPALMDLSKQGVNLFPDDRRARDGYKEAAASSASILALRRKTAAEEAAVETERVAMIARAGTGLTALRAKMAAAEEAEGVRRGAQVFKIRQVIRNAQTAAAADEAKTEGARLALVQRASEGILKLRASQAAQERAQMQRDSDALLRVKRAMATAESAEDLRRMASAAARGKYQVGMAMASPAGAFSALSGAKAGTTVSPEDISRTRGLTAAQQGLNKALQDGHSAARGLASGMNAMWLTWGNLGPLLAGAAVSNAFVQSIKKGAEFEQRLAAIRYLGGESAESVGGLATAALDLARVGIAGPVELAGALKALSLAGLDATEQLAALKPVVNFSIAGEMEVDKAAESLVAISTAFGYTAKGFGTVGDVISKAAAISMSSVESMTQSFKVASTVAQQYGVDIQDAATSLALLSQVGIRGTAAGTAMRNMYTELMGTSKKAREVLLNTIPVKIFDNATKSARPLLDIFTDMSKALAGMDFESQQKALTDLGNERGLKALSANLMAINQQAKDMGTGLPSRLAEIRKALEDAPGFAAVAAIGMAQTTQNQIKGIFASLEAALVESFGAVNPVVQSLARDLRTMINSDGFNTALQGLVGGIANLLRVLLNNIDVLAAVATGYVSAKAAILAYSVIQPLVAAGAAAVTAGVAASGVAASGAAVAFRVLLVAMGPIGALAAAVGVAYLFMADKAESSAKKATFALDAHFDSTMEGLDKEIARLKDEEKALDASLANKVYVSTLQQEIGMANLRLLNQQAMATRNLAAEELARENAIAKTRLEGNKTPWAKDQLATINANERDSAANLSRAARAGAAREAALARKQKELFDQAKIVADKAREEAAKNRNIPTGGGAYDPDSKESKARDRKSDYERAVEAATEYIQKLKEEAENAGLTAEQQMMLAAARAANLAPTETLTAAIMNQALATLQAKNASDEAAAAVKRETEALEQKRSVIEQAQGSAMSLESQLEGEREKISLMGVEGQALAELTAKKYEDNAATQLRLAAIADEIDWSGQLGDAYRRQAEALQGLADAAREAASKQNDIDLFKEAEKENQEFWSSVDSTAKEVFTSVAEEGEDAFEKIGKTLKAAVLDMLYQMTVKKWIFQISGQGGGGAGGGGGGIDWVDLATKGYNWMTGGSGASAAYSLAGAGSSAGGLGLQAATTSSSLATGAANYSIASGATTTGGLGLQAGSTGAATLTTGATATGTGLTTAAAGTTTAAGTTAAAGGAAAGGMTAASVIPIVGWVVAAMAIGSSLYDKGWNRDVAKTSGMYDKSFENQKTNLLEGLGMSDKWASILGGSTRFGHMFGHKQSQAGVRGNFDGAGGIQTDQYQVHKGGVFRNDKEFSQALDPGEAEKLSAQLRQLQNDTATLVTAMGGAGESVKTFAGGVTINLMGLTRTEAMEKMAEEFQELQYRMAEAAGISKDAFIAMMEASQGLAERFGATGGAISDLLVAGMTGRLAEPELAAQLADVIMGGIYNSIASVYADPIAQMFQSQIIQPILTAALSGAPLAGIVSQATMAGVVNQARASMAALNQIFQDPAFKAFMSELEGTIKQVSNISVRPARHIRAFGTAALAAANEAKRAAAEIKAAWQQISDSITDEIKRIRGELVKEDPRGLAYTQAQFAIKTAQARSGNQDAARELPGLSQALLDIAELNSNSRLDFLRIQAQTEASLLATNQILARRYRLDLPQYAVGTNYVPKDMVAQIHEGEAIIPKAFNPFAGGGAGGSNAGLERQVALLTAKVNELILVNEEIEGHTRGVNTKLAMVTRGGPSIYTQPATTT